MTKKNLGERKFRLEHIAAEGEIKMSIRFLLQAARKCKGYEVPIPASLAEYFPQGQTHVRLNPSNPLNNVPVSMDMREYYNMLNMSHPDS
jgi:hypothetical protein